VDYEDEEAEEEVEVEEGGRSMEDLRGIVQLVRFLFFFYLCGVIGDYCCGQGVFSSIVFFSEGV
jgi:hypothetical protein